ncbi:MAG TPA: hypothetical protein VLH86_00345 [Patescibacteria group bacterium]|nr:hypothetical protein [Patescibacteria group bacterium]
MANMDEVFTGVNQIFAEGGAAAAAAGALAQAEQQIADALGTFDALTQGSTNEAVQRLRDRLANAAHHIGEAAVDIAIAEGIKDTLVEQWCGGGTGSNPAIAATPYAAGTAQPGSEVTFFDPAPAAIEPVDAARGGSQVIEGDEIIAASGERIAGPKTAEDRMKEPAATILDEEFYDVNYFTGDRLRDAGITDVRDFYLAGSDGVQDAHALNFNDALRLRRDLAEQFPDLPQLPNKRGDPAVAARVYESLDEVPAAVLYGDFIRKNFGKSARMSARELLDQLSQEDYTLQGDFSFNTRGLGGISGLRVLNELRAFADKFDDAKRRQSEQ